MLQGIMAQWTSPDFMTAVAAREGVHLDPASLVAVTILGSYGPQRPSVLAARMVTGASNISKIAARLQEAGPGGKTGGPPGFQGVATCPDRRRNGDCRRLGAFGKFAGHRPGRRIGRPGIATTCCAY